MYKVYLTEAGFKRYICLACGMKKSSSKERIISHLRSRHFHLISDSKFKCKSTILDNKEIQYSIQWNNKDYYENKEEQVHSWKAGPGGFMTVENKQTNQYLVLLQVAKCFVPVQIYCVGPKIYFYIVPVTNILFRTKR